MALVVIAVMVIYSGLPSVALSALPVTHDATGYHTPARRPVRRRPDPRDRQEHGPRLLPDAPPQYYVGVLAATILLIASNAGIIGVSRLTYSMGQHQQLPERLRRISPRFRTPANGILVFGADRLPRDHPGQGGVPGNALRVRRDAVVHDRACLADRAALAAGAHNRMRKLPGDVEVEGEEDAWYKAPFNVRFGGVDVPLFAVIGGLGTFAAWIAVMALYTDDADRRLDLARARRRHVRRSTGGARACR